MQGYKTVLVDLDPQCNLSRLALGDNYYEKNLFSSTEKDIFDVLKGVIEGGSDIDLNVPFLPVSKSDGNLSLMKGSVNLSLYENLLVTAYGQAAAGDRFPRNTESFGWSTPPTVQVHRSGNAWAAPWGLPFP